MGKKSSKNRDTPNWIGLKKSKPKEGISKYFKPLRMSTFSRLTSSVHVTSIYFCTNEHKLCINDKAELDRLVKDICYLLENGFKLEIDAIGGADFRANRNFNNKLGYQRAHEVKLHLCNQINDTFAKVLNGSKYLKTVSITESSIGESDARQPKAGINVSRNIISKDRRVDVFVKNKDFKPPISIAIVGTIPMFNKDIERLEKNNLGEVVAIESSDEPKFNNEEQNYLIQKGKRKGDVDHCLPSIVIKITCSLSKPTDTNIGYVKCLAYNKTNNNLLFVAYAQTNQIELKDLTVYVYTHPMSKGRGTIVSRVYKKRNEWLLAEGYKEEKRILSYNDFNDPYQERFLFLLVDKIYDQLKGSFTNIKSRVEHMLRY